MVKIRWAGWAVGRVAALVGRVAAGVVWDEQGALQQMGRATRRMNVACQPQLFKTNEVPDARTCSRLWSGYPR